jgi:hypothetical protein
MIDALYLKNLQFTDFRVERTLLMANIAESIAQNQKSGLIAKGGTALLFCYKLPRYSTDAVCV